MHHGFIAWRAQQGASEMKVMEDSINEPVPVRQDPGVCVDLIAVLAAVTDGEPRIMTIRDATALPSGPLGAGHRSLQSGLRAWVERQTHHPLGYMEQLYTFADSDRAPAVVGRRTISISYLGLTREKPPSGADAASWRSWYDYFPWEDRRSGVPVFFSGELIPALREWARAETAVASDRWQRAAIAFGLDGHGWNEELVLQRYELLYEAAFVPEARRSRPAKDRPLAPGYPMVADHRRILATGIARLRAKIKYRPVVFELMPPDFTLLQLQRCVEALAGRQLHKQNFRRLVEQQELVEETGDTTPETGGRPAKLFRFRQAVRVEQAAGARLPLARG
jgi:hypothetical protein